MRKQKSIAAARKHIAKRRKRAKQRELSRQQHFNSRKPEPTNKET